jgi:hypothetical protein
MKVATGCNARNAMAALTDEGRMAIAEDADLLGWPHVCIEFAKVRKLRLTGRDMALLRKQANAQQ